MNSDGVNGSNPGSKVLDRSGTIPNRESTRTRNPRGFGTRPNGSERVAAISKTAGCRFDSCPTCPEKPGIQAHFAVGFFIARQLWRGDDSSSDQFGKMSLHTSGTFPAGFALRRIRPRRWQCVSVPRPMSPSAVAFGEELAVEPGWRSILSWFVGAGADHAINPINPDAERAAAQRMGSEES